MTTPTSPVLKNKLASRFVEECLSRDLTVGRNNYGGDNADLKVPVGPIAPLDLRWAISLAGNEVLDAGWRGSVPVQVCEHLRPTGQLSSKTFDYRLVDAGYQHRFAVSLTRGTVQFQRLVSEPRGAAGTEYEYWEVVREFRNEV